MNKSPKVFHPLLLAAFPVVFLYSHNIGEAFLPQVMVPLGACLAGTKAKQDRLWERAQKAMEKLKIKPAIIKHIMTRRDVTILAKNVEGWLKAGK